MLIGRRVQHNGPGFPGGIIRLNRGHALCAGLQFALFAPSYLDLVNEQMGALVLGSSQWKSQGAGTATTGGKRTLGMGFSGVVPEYSYLPAINPPLSVFAFADFGLNTICSFGGSGAAHGWAAAMDLSGTGIRSRFTFGGVADYVLAADIPDSNANGGVYTHVWTVDKNGGTFNAYVNGVSAGAGVTVGTMLSITQPFDVGAARGGGGLLATFTKSIGCVMVWNRVISPAEIAMLHVDPYQVLNMRNRIIFGAGVLFGARPMSIMT